MPKPLPGTVLTPTEKARIHAAIRNTCSTSLMSDTKWRKLFSVIKTIPSIKYYFLKSLRCATEGAGYGYIGGQAPHAFVDTLSFGPIYLREIEWIEFPEYLSQRTHKTQPPDAHHQNLDELRRRLTMIGQFPMVETPRGLRITGHVRKTLVNTSTRKRADFI